MKAAFLCLCMLPFIIGNTFLYAEEVRVDDTLRKNIIDNTLFPCIKALKDGNVRVIKHYLTEDMYNKSRVLLEQNKGYPEFLRTFYKGAVFTVKKLLEVNGDIIVTVIAEFPNRGSSVTNLLLTQDKVNIRSGDTSGVWRIAKAQRGYKWRLEDRKGN
ncbi:MAG: hypothetical protein U9N47_13775 [Thermodesulfobacteriota bacterium]|nr:hypothetical protein [Thermodesulfobacteriota bacterium]